MAKHAKEINLDDEQKSNLNGVAKSDGATAFGDGSIFSNKDLRIKAGRIFSSRDGEDVSSQINDFNKALNLTSTKPIDKTKSTVTSSGKKKSKVKVVIGILACVVIAACASVGGYFAHKYIFSKDLSAETLGTEITQNQTETPGTSNPESNIPEDQENQGENSGGESSGEGGNGSESGIETGIESGVTASDFGKQQIVHIPTENGGEIVVSYNEDSNTSTIVSVNGYSVGEDGKIQASTPMAGTVGDDDEQAKIVAAQDILDKVVGSSNSEGHKDSAGGSDLESYGELGLN